MENTILFIDNNIPQMAYKGNSTIRHIRIGQNVASMCPNIESIEVDKNNKLFTSGNGCNAIIEKSSGILLAGCYKTEIPEYVTEIGPFAFCGQTLMKKIMIPHNVRKIGAFSFDGCSELVEVKIGDGVEFIGEYCFKKCINLETIHLPNKKIDIDTTIFGVAPFNWDNMEASLHEWDQEPKISPHFVGILNIFFDGEVEQYVLISDFAERYLSCSFIENTRIIRVFCKNATLTYNKWNFSV